MEYTEKSDDNEYYLAKYSSYSGKQIPKNVRRLLPKIIRRLINKKFFKYYFLKTDLQNLPKISYPEKTELEYQKELIEKSLSTNRRSIDIKGFKKFIYGK